MSLGYSLYTINDRKGVDMILCDCGWQKCFPSHQYGPAIRNFYIIHYLTSGKGYYKVNGREYELNTGEAFLIWPSELHSYRADPDDPYEYLWVSFYGAEASNYLEMIGLSPDEPVLAFENYDEIISALTSIIDAVKKNDAPSKIAALGRLYVFLSILAYQSPKHSEDTLSGSPYVVEAMKYIHANYSRNITVNDIAKSVSLNRCYLSTIFKQQIQMSPLQYLISYRISQACKLMKSTDLSINEIGRSVGFQDHMNFSTRFKKYKGISPGAYRKKDFDNDEDIPYNESGLSS